MKKHVPNILTLCNLLSGIIAVVFAYNGDFRMALLFVVIGVLFDFCDGAAARALGVVSPVGKELDSLADMVTSGLVPGMVAFKLLGGLAEYWCVLPYIGFLISLFSALRLAQFNVDERQTSSFIGLATPANALFWLGLSAGYADTLRTPTIIVLILLTSWLLVSPIPMFSLKFHGFGMTRLNIVRYVFLALSLVLLICFGVKGLPLVIGMYVGISVVLMAIEKKN